MNRSKLVSTFFSIFLSIATLISNQSFAIMGIGKCPDWDSNLNEVKAKGRWDWVRKCVPGAERLYESGHTTDFGDGDVRIAYPTLGIIDSETNLPSNPNNFVAPTDGKASCDGLPPDYEIVNFCTVN